MARALVFAGSPRWLSGLRCWCSRPSGPGAAAGLSGGSCGQDLEGGADLLEPPADTCIRVADAAAGNPFGEPQPRRRQGGRRRGLQAARAHRVRADLPRDDHCLDPAPVSPPLMRQTRTGAPGRIRTADASLRTAALYPLSYGGARRDRTRPRARRARSAGAHAGVPVPRTWACWWSYPEAMRKRALVFGLFVAVIFVWYWLFPGTKLQQPAPTEQPVPTVVSS